MEFRKAKKTDVPAIVEMTTDDELGKTREYFQIPLTGKSGWNEPLIPEEIEQSKSSVKIDSICLLKLVFF